MESRHRVAVLSAAGFLAGAGYLARKVAELSAENADLKARLAGAAPAAATEPVATGCCAQKEAAEPPAVAEAPPCCSKDPAPKQEEPPKKKRGWGALKKAVVKAPSGGALAKGNEKHGGELR